MLRRDTLNRLSMTLQIDLAASLIRHFLTSKIFERLNFPELKTLTGGETGNPRTSYQLALADGGPNVVLRREVLKCLFMTSLIDLATFLVMHFLPKSERRNFSLGGDYP